LSAVVASCGGCSDDDRAVPVYTSYDYEETDGSAEDKTTERWDMADTSPYGEDEREEAVVPYHSMNGVKYVDVKVNGVGLEMIFDTGCAGMHISLAEARYLYDKGTLTDDDFLGVSPAVTADGNVSVDMVVNLREVIISDQVVRHNVAATVSANTDAPLLLGNGVLDSIESTTIDNENQTIIFRFKEK
ncbi:MAG: retroviral-like aspartic protease family protein, partial [Prevotellaceae bacterium]|nr:retroviral-like aspartic protease family protein [Prevotellaceae bacterium]